MRPPYDETLAALRPLARQFPTLDASLAEVARLSAEMTLPMSTVHVLSDVHGDDVKLRHVINNASGLLRPLVKRVFAARMREEDMPEFLSLLFYPRETLQRLESELRDPDARQTFCRRVLGDLFFLVNLLARRYPFPRALEAVPADYRDLFAELLREPGGDRGPQFHEALIGPLVRHDRALHLLRTTVRVVRNLAIDELVIGGDCWDRGPRGDRVVDYLMRQPRLAFVWGNHDVAWLGACLGCDALIAHVLRISLRYARLAQLEDGYAIPLGPVEQLARSAYGDDSATGFMPKIAVEAGGRDALLLARMQKAVAIMQFKLEGELIARHPEWHMDDRRLLHTVEGDTVAIAGKRYRLKDSHFPTLDPRDPYALSDAERACLEAVRGSFLTSQTLWSHMAFLLRNGGMALRRDDNLIFHACVPVDEAGAFLPMEIDGRPVAGKAMFDALDRVLARILDDASSGLPESSVNTRANDRELMWYLWSGPRSPLFGKDKIATFEIDFVEDKAIQAETKNPYFSLIHEAGFCDRVLAEFGANPARGLIVNGHVPVKIEKGESPMKRSGKAITIDGAFSEAYGDHGYTLVIEPNRTVLATHHHFESVEAAVREGKDIIPTISVIRINEPVRRIADTEKGAEISARVVWLERLVQAYRENRLGVQP